MYSSVLHNCRAGGNGAGCRAVAVRCSVLQCVAVCCTIAGLEEMVQVAELLQCIDGAGYRAVAVHCSVLQSVAMCCNVVHDCGAEGDGAGFSVLQCVAV